jgi:Virulence factor BrkB
MATSDGKAASTDAPEGLTNLSAGSWKDALKRMVKAFKEDKLTDWAAALTYYGVLAIFPALLVVVSVIGLIGESATDTLIENLEDVAPGPAQEIFTNAIRNLEGAGSASGVAFVIGLAGAIWASSGYVNGFMSASNSILDVDDAGSLVKTLPVRVGLTLVLMVLAGVIAFAVTLTGGLAKEVGNLIGLGDTAVDVWNLAKWPVLLFLVSVLLAVLLGRPEREAAVSPVLPRGTARRAGLGDRVGGVRLLRLELRLVQQDLRGAGRSDRVPAVALDLEHLHPARGGAKRRARTGPQARDGRDQRPGQGVHRAALLTRAQPSASWLPPLSRSTSRRHSSR